MYDLIYQALMLCEPQQKCQAVHTLYQQALQQGWQPQADPQPVVAVPDPGRPDAPELVAPRFSKNRPLTTLRGRKALIHAVTHIEFNAINLALDAAWRFRDMPEQYYLDWLRVADDEARHFELLSARLAELDMQYGDLVAHNGLWQAACKTDHDVMVRMALVPRVLEARGLDVTPLMIEKLTAAGDDKSVAALSVILAEEVAHVEIGSRWFKYCCDQRGLAPEPTFVELLDQYNGVVRPPFNEKARLKAGFSKAELASLSQLA